MRLFCFCKLIVTISDPLEGQIQYIITQTIFCHSNITQWYTEKLSDAVNKEAIQQKIHVGNFTDMSAK